MRAENQRSGMSWQLQKPRDRKIVMRAKGIQGLLLKTLKQKCAFRDLFRSGGNLGISERSSLSLNKY